MRRAGSAQPSRRPGDSGPAGEVAGAAPEAGAGAARSGGKPRRSRGSAARSAGGAGNGGGCVGDGEEALRSRGGGTGASSRHPELSILPQVFPEVSPTSNAPCAYAQ